MTIGSIKVTKKRLVFLIIFAAALLAAVVLACSVPADGDVATPEGRIAYLSRLGWEADPASEEREAVLLPREFGDVLTEYNRLQRSQGFDLTLYAGMDCLRYTYRLTNYPGCADAVAQLFIRGSRVIGGDIHSPALDGFMHSLK